MNIFATEESFSEEKIFATEESFSFSFSEESIQCSNKASLVFYTQTLAESESIPELVFVLYVGCVPLKASREVKTHERKGMRH